MICNNITIGSNGNLFFAGQDTVELAKKYSTPLYLMDEERIRHNCRIYAEAMKKYFGGKALALYASKAASFAKIYSIVKEQHLDKMVGMTRFERATPSSQARCATKLRYIPKPLFSFQLFQKRSLAAKLLFKSQDMLAQCATSRNLYLVFNFFRNAAWQLSYFLNRKTCLLNALHPETFI